MIQWVALALAADAECTASTAKAQSNTALRRANEAGGDPFVVVQPFNFQEVSAASKTDGFWKTLFAGNKLILEKKSFAKWSLRRSDLRNLEQGYDGDNKPYVKVHTSPEYADFYVPGTVEQVSAALNGKRSNK